MKITSCIFGLGSMAMIMSSVYYMDKPAIWWAMLPVVGAIVFIEDINN